MEYFHPRHADILAAINQGKPYKVIASELRCYNSDIAKVKRMAGLRVTKHKRKCLQQH